jgi:lysophospholipase L1-like esterase
MSRGAESMDAPRRGIPASRKLLYAAIVTTVFFAGAEVLTRVFWHPSISEDIVGTRKFVTWLSSVSLGDAAPLEMYQADPTRLWGLIPDRHYTSFNYHRDPQGESQPIEITVNSHGYRGPLISPQDAASATTSVLCLGDSHFFGYPLDDRDAFPRALQDAIQSQTPAADVRVINAGVPGYSSLQGRAWFEEEFAGTPFNWLILSYLCNDAWPQPKADKELLAAQPPAAVVRLAQAVVSKSRLLQSLQLALINQRAGGPKVRRVNLADFSANYEFFVEQAHQRRARVLVLDYNVYPEYARYSQALGELCQRHPDVHYFNVPQQATQAINAGEIFTNYADRLAKIRQRWGDPTLKEHPHLWLYAEFNPEHLNEMGTAWLAAQVAEIMARDDREGAAAPVSSPN